MTRTRELHRKPRRETPAPVVALVGYTNAGKSTLFNRLTGADVMAMDKLFATLDPTLRGITLPSGLHIVLSDTVGFISDLPHELVAAFRATLEEVIEADLLLHVRDISHADSAAQKEDVLQVLKSLLSAEELEKNLIEVWNKLDLLPEGASPPVNNGPVATVSALTGAGIPQLVRTLDARLSSRFMETLTVKIPAADGKSLAWLHQHGSVVKQVQRKEVMTVTAQLTHENAARWKKRKDR